MPEKIFYALVITSLLIAVIITFFIVSVIRYHRRYIRLQKERFEAEILMQEQERKRIANDLHDSLGPLLSTVKLYLHSVRVSNEDDKQLLHKASNYIDETITSLREISYNLLPSSLGRKGLADTLKEYISRLTGRHVLKIDFHPDENLTIPSNSEIHLFRILHEIIHNTIKHAQAASLHLFILNEKEELVIISEDDGVGFDFDHTRETSFGLGLKSIESRCELIGASLQLVTAKDKGCKIIIKLPKL